jgi:hypothetical protein
MIEVRYPDPDPYLVLTNLDPGGQKHTDPTNPDPTPDPQHRSKITNLGCEEKGTIHFFSHYMF